MEDFALFKQAKRIVNGLEDYPVAKMFFDTYGDHQEKIWLDGIDDIAKLRPIEVVSHPTDRHTFAGPGFFALNSGRGVIMAIVDCDEISFEFLDESKIVGLILGDRVRQVGHNSLLQYLRYIYVKSSNPFLFAENNVLFTKDKSVLISYAARRPEEEYTVGRETKELGAYAFCDAAHLKKLYLPKGIKVGFNSLPRDETEVIYY